MLKTKHLPARLTPALNKGFALPTIMIASVVMLTVLLSGLVATSSVNVGLREQINAKQLSHTSKAGLIMAEACLKTTGQVTWSDTQPLRPNTDCYGQEIVPCPESSNDARCYLSVAGQNRTSFKVGAVRNDNSSFIVEALSQSLRTSTGTVASQQNSKIRGYQVERKGTNVSASSQTTCAVSSDKRVYCWGQNGYGNVGNGSTTPAVNPNPLLLTPSAALPANTDMQSVTTGHVHSCALTTAGKAYCWGTGTWGGLGNNNGNTDSYTPVAVAQGEVPLGVGFTSLTNGYYHTCGIATDKKVYCWGDNLYGQLGIGTAGGTFSYPRAVAMPAGVSATSLSSAYVHTCAVGSDAKVYCWGYNGQRQLGNNSSVQQFNSPVKVLTNTSGTELTATAVGVGYYHSCAVGTDGNPYCWGQNTGYELGNGLTSQAVVATRTSQGDIPTNVKFTHISSNYQTTCGIGTNFRVYCWGQNGYSQVGNGSTAVATVPTLASSVVNGPGATITGISVANYSTCINTNEAKIFCWGKNDSGQNGNGGITSPSGVAQVAGSSTALGVSSSVKLSFKFGTVCAIGPDEKAYCWGENGYSQGGNGTTAVQPSPTAVLAGAMPAGTKIRDLEAGWTHICALSAENKAYCWGNNNNGQIGNGTTSTTAQSTPAAVSQGAIPAGVTLRTLVVNGLHTCGIGSDGKAYCWGRNDYGQLGNGTTTQSTTPVAVSQGAIPAGVTIISMATGNSHTCAIGSNGKTYCWGRNDAGGSLGNNSLTNSSLPVAVVQGAIPTGVTLRSLSVNGLTTCAIGSDGKAYCWGYSTAGHLGNGTTSSSSTPVAVSQGAIPAGVTIRSLSVGYGDQVCTIASDDKIYCWGDWYANGTTADSTVPVYATSQNTLPAGVKPRSIVSGSSTNCILGSDAKAYCWGSNTSGAFGNGTTNMNSTITFSSVIQSLRWPSAVTTDSFIVRY